MCAPDGQVQRELVCIGTVIIQASTSISRWAALPTYRQGMWTTWPTHWWTALTPPRRSWLPLVIREEIADVVNVKYWRMLKTPGSQGWGHSMLPMALIPEMRSRVDQESTTDMLPQVKFAQNLHKICTPNLHTQTQICISIYLCQVVIFCIMPQSSLVIRFFYLVFICNCYSPMIFCILSPLWDVLPDEALGFAHVVLEFNKGEILQFQVTTGRG